MKLVTIALAAAASVLGGAAYANTADDIKWIAQCMQDNKSETGISVDIAFKYCKCMNNKMSNNESQPISQWEKSHPNERKACDAEAGWK